MSSVWDLFDRRTTAKGEEVLHLLRSLSDAEELREELKQYMIGEDIAILAIGEEAQPFGDIISLSIYTTAGKGPYRNTIRVQESGISDAKKQELETELHGKKVIVVDTSYNRNNEAFVEREFGRNGYKIEGLMYMSSYPEPYGQTLRIRPEPKTPHPNPNVI